MNFACFFEFDLCQSNRNKVSSGISAFSLIKYSVEYKKKIGNIEQLIFALSCSLNIYKKQSIVGQLLFGAVLFFFIGKCHFVAFLALNSSNWCLIISLSSQVCSTFLHSCQNVHGRVNLWQSQLSREFRTDFNAAMLSVRSWRFLSKKAQNDNTQNSETNRKGGNFSIKSGKCISMLHVSSSSSFAALLTDREWERERPATRPKNIYHDMGWIGV